MAAVQEGVCRRRADCGAFAAVDAEIFSEEDLRFGGDAFRIVAPDAAERAAFDEDSVACAWAVVDCEPSDVCDRGGWFHFMHLLTLPRG